MLFVCWSTSEHHILSFNVRRKIHIWASKSGLRYSIGWHTSLPMWFILNTQRMLRCKHIICFCNCVHTAHNLYAYDNTCTWSTHNKSVLYHVLETIKIYILLILKNTVTRLYTKRSGFCAWMCPCMHACIAITVEFHETYLNYQFLCMSENWLYAIR